MTLTPIWVLPLVGAVAVAFLPGLSAKVVGVLFAGADLVMAGMLALFFVPGHPGYQFTEHVAWIPQLSVFYGLGVDGISVWLVVLNAFLTLIAVLATPVTARTGGFVGLMLAMSAGLAGVFMATDLVLFYVFWEAMLIPAYFLLWLYGEGKRPGYAALKFVLYTLAGSLLMLVGVIGEYVATGKQTFDLTQLATLAPSPSIQFALFFVFALAFAIKTPLFPFHSWLPDAYNAAPTPMLITFAGVMGKAGAYGFLRIAVPLFPQPVDWWDWRWVIPVLAVAAIIWGALMALVQRDMKMLVSYSSVSHMGFIVLGIFSFNIQGQQGAVVQMVNHGIIIAALFLIVGWIGDRVGPGAAHARDGGGVRRGHVRGVGSSRAQQLCRRVHDPARRVAEGAAARRVRCDRPRPGARLHAAAVPGRDAGRPGETGAEIRHLRRTAHCARAFDRAHVRHRADSRRAHRPDDLRRPGRAVPLTCLPAQI
jgi:NADH-quinone oxidoreductase subunit M